MGLKERVIDAEKVKKFRTDLLDGDSEGTFYPNDVEKINTNDVYCQRFIDHEEGDVVKAVKLAAGALKWRKEFEVEKINLEMFPKDLLGLCSLYTHGKDKDGALVLIFHVKKHKKNSKWVEFYHKFIIYWFEKLEKEGDGREISVIFDCIGSGLTNMDMDIMRFIVDSFILRYPSFLNNILVIEIPWVLNAAWKIIKLWLPTKSIEKVKFINRKDAFKYIDASELLECMGGEDKFVFQQVEQE